ncbi:MAG: hypothetical protein IJJ74_04330 [Eubacterium sp.]|nr:hypothetical protein [Eubacterium sp.]
MDMDYNLISKLYDIAALTGCSDEEITELTAGFSEIPAALMSFWKKCGGTDKLFTTSNDPWVNLPWCRQYKYMQDTSCGYYFLLDENQCVYRCGIRLEDMSIDDPPVYVVEPLPEGNLREVGQAASSVTEFIMGMLIYEAGMGAIPYIREDIICYTFENIKQIESLLKKLPYHIYNWYCDRIDFYTHSGNEVLFIMMSEDPNGTYSANSKDTYEKFNALVGNIGKITICC